MTSIKSSISRRRFIRFGAALVSGAAFFLSGCASLFKKDEVLPKSSARDFLRNGDKFDYVVVGSGAGGGPLAANLALAGFRVLLLEAGGDEEPCDYHVPAFHANVSEHEDLRWDFFVRHYANDEQQRRDSKFVPERDGVLYPRSGTLGGCTAHNAMILICPHNSDWNYIAELTGDQSWRGENMRQYFERLENCRYPTDPFSRHGFKGWLPTSLPDPRLLLRDRVLLQLAKAALKETWRTLPARWERLKLKLMTRLDPNDWRFVQDSRQEGLCKVPLTTLDGRRVGSREFVRRVWNERPDYLVVRTRALVTQILLDEDNKAVGVKYRQGAHLYRADPRTGAAGEDLAKEIEIRVGREVIVSAGAFNTPQLLKLSGIGPKEELERHGIEVKVDLPGVGENLQDRYEVGVVTRLKRNIPLVRGMTLRCPDPGEMPDPLFRQWLQHRGPYTANGAVLALMKRSSRDRAHLDPDLLIFGLIGEFRGYYPGYSKQIPKENYFSWAILKAHTNNRAGRVTLRSKDPRDVPDINFHYFSEGSDEGEDLGAVIAGVETVRAITKRNRNLIEEEVVPGPKVRTREDIRQFIQDEAWGHHASCTCQMGPRSNPMAVVDSRFRVHGTQNLRIVDASVFPRIPGFFIVSAIYMISEKAKDVIIEDAKRTEGNQASG